MTRPWPWPGNGGCWRIDGWWSVDYARMSWIQHQHVGGIDQYRHHPVNQGEGGGSFGPVRSVQISPCGGAVTAGMWFWDVLITGVAGMCTACGISVEKRYRCHLFAEAVAALLHASLNLRWPHRMHTSSPVRGRANPETFRRYTDAGARAHWASAPIFRPMVFDGFWYNLAYSRSFFSTSPVCSIDWLCSWYYMLYIYIYHYIYIYIYIYIHNYIFIYIIYSQIMAPWSHPSYPTCGLPVDPVDPGLRHGGAKDPESGATEHPKQMCWGDFFAHGSWDWNCESWENIFNYQVLTQVRETHHWLYMAVQKKRWNVNKLYNYLLILLIVLLEVAGEDDPIMKKLAWMEHGTWHQKRLSGQ